MMQIKNRQSFLDKEQGQKGMKKGMKKWKKLIIIGIVIIMGTGVCGCSMKRNDSNGKKLSEMGNKVAELVLNERQKEILEEVGLSTDVEELTYMQKRAIITIDEMLTAVEEKYNRSFSYAGYVAPGLLEYEHLIAYPSDGARSFDSFEVRKVEGENGTEYEDDYMNVVVRDDFSEYMTEIASEVFHTEAVKVFSDVEVTEAILSEIPSDKKMYNGAVGSYNVIYVDSTFIDVEAFQTYVDDLKKVLFENELYSISEIICLKGNVIENLNKYNYSYYDISDSYIEWKEISVQSYMEENNDIR